MTHLAISLLGPFQVTLDGAAVTSFGSDTARALLAYLAMHPGVAHRREALAGLLWPEQPDTEALRNLRVALSRLRDAIGDREADSPFLEATRQTIQLADDARCSLDVRAMREALAATKEHEHAQLEGCGICAKRLHEAAALYRGEFLAGFTLDSVPFEEWLVVEREALHWQALEALDALARCHEGQRAYEEAIACARRAVALEPWHEAAHRQWMRALALSGHRGAALAQYEACRQVLAEELGVEPEPATVTLVEQIRTGALAPAGERIAERVTVEARVEAAPPPVAVTTPEETPPLSPLPLVQGVPEGERRIVTALYVAVACAGAGGEALDIEARAEAVSGALWRVESEVVRLGGEVSQRRGEGLVAMFGVTAAHEDDPERAVLAALAIEEAIGRYGEEVARGEGIALRVRMGISTGEAVVTRMGEGASEREETALGEEASLGERLLELAGAEGVRVAAQTYCLVAPLFEWRAVGEVALNGAPVPVYRPLARKPEVGKGRGIEGLSSPLVGREAEFSALQSAVERLRSGSGGIVTVVGEAGLGKSRLVAEVRARAKDVGWVEGRCLSYGSAVAYLPWLEMLCGLVGETADAAPAAVRETLRERVRRLCGERAGEVYPYLGRLLSLPLEEEAEGRLRGLDAEGLRVLTFRAAETLLERAARQRPLVVVIEDLHWADPTSLALLEQVLALTDRVPVCFFCVLRPETGHGCWRVREAAARDYRHRHVDLWLEPLSRAESERLVGSLLEVEALPQALRERILSYTEGNPFYLEEVLRALIAEGAIAYDKGTGRWEAARDVAALSIPDTLHGVLAARIDRLPRGARQVLQLAAVIGHVFAYPVLAGVVGEGGDLDEHLVTHLVALERAQMVRERARVPEVEYAFHHVLTMEAAYRGLLRRKRRALHRRVAEALERLYPDRIEDQLGLLAHHWEQAGDALQAVEYLRRAGEQAAARYANEEAVHYLSRALNLMPPDDLADRYAVLSLREAVHDLQGAREVQRADLSQLQEIAEALAQRDGEQEGAHRRAEVAVREANFYDHTQDHTALADAAQKIVCLGREIGDMGIEAEGYLQWGTALHRSWDSERARVYWEKALGIARAAGSQYQEARVLRELGINSHRVDLYDTARTYLERNWQIHRELGNRIEEGKALNALAWVARRLHDLGQAKAYAEDGLRLCRLTGNRREEAHALSSLGRALSRLGQHAASDQHYQESILLFRQVGDPFGEGLAFAGRGWAAHDAGNDDASRIYSDQALRLADKANAGEARVIALVSLGNALAGKAHWSDASAAYQEALPLCRRFEWHHYVVSAQAGLADIALSQKEPHGAMAYAREILRHIEAYPALHGTFDPMHMYLTCYRVLSAVDDSRAEEVLHTAHGLLQAWADKIEDEDLRRSFLENVPANREIVAVYTRGHSSG